MTLGLQEATGEVLSRYDFSLPGLPGNGAAPSKQQAPGWQPWFRPRGRRRQAFLVYIITEQAEAVSKRILTEMQRGVTALAGTGMYTGQARRILICVVTATEIAHLKALVRAEDGQAFVTISPAQEVLGAGFAPLQDAAGPNN